MSAVGFHGYNAFDQQQVGIRTVSAGVLQEKNGKFFCPQYALKINNNGYHGTTIRKPAVPDIFLPATVGEIEPVRRNLGSNSIVAQRLRGVTVVDMLEQTTGNGRRKRKKEARLGSLAIKPIAQF